MSKRTEKQPEEQNTFAEVITAIDALESDPARHLSIQIDDAVRDAVQAAQTSGQPASVTIQVKIKPGAERRMSFIAHVKAQLPRPPVGGVTLYADANGHVHHSDPKQSHLEFYDPAAQPKKEN